MFNRRNIPFFPLRSSWTIFFVLSVILAHLFINNAYAQERHPQSNADTFNAYRILHVVLRGNNYADAREIVKLAKKSGFTAIQFMITRGISLEHAPWTPIPGAWSKAQLIDWVTYIRENGLEPIPEIKLLTHQDKYLAKKYPELLYNAFTYDPRLDFVYTLTFQLLDEIIDSIRPSIIHIGHDEAIGWNRAHTLKKLKTGEKPLPADLFLFDVLKLHSYLRSKDIEVWMWGDMLASPNEFPNMLANHLHGGMVGYGKKLRDQLPRDIVICDWHYFDKQEEFPFLERMQSEGFRVVAATWSNEQTIRNFARYALQHHAYGLMATTWYSIDSPKDGPLVDWIVRTSGRLFHDPSASDIEPQPVLDASGNPQ